MPIIVALAFWALHYTPSCSFGIRFNFKQSSVMQNLTEQFIIMTDFKMSFPAKGIQSAFYAGLYAK